LQRVALDRLVPEAAAAARAAIPAARIDVTGDPVVVRADPEMMRAVLVNLLLNAVHASAGSIVEVRTAASTGWGTVEILDRGPGLPAEVRQHLFEPFITTRQGGTGLGLPIANRLTVQQGGTLAIDDRPGGGTTAVVRLPNLEMPAQ
jgi:signal transduction histidine kinase